jgi:preprotein translocase subunit SecA
MRSTDSAGAAALHGYPEREDAHDSLADRLVSGFSTRLQRFRRNGFDDPEANFALLRAKADALAGTTLHSCLPGLRYRSRRAGDADALIADSLALLAHVASRKGIPVPPPVAFAAAKVQLLRGIAAVADEDSRAAALVLAVCAAALSGDPVHVFARSDARAGVLAAMLNDYLEPLGLGAAVVTQGMDFRARHSAYSAPVTCATTREIGTDYLRDRLQLGERRGALVNMASRLSGDAPVEDRLLLRGLHCAFVEDAEMLMIDDARLPLMISAEADQSRERLLYEQALELARGLQAGRDFDLNEDGISLTEAGRRRLELLVSPLGGIWAARTRCEALIVIALRVLHEFMRDRDYQVAKGRVVFPTPPGKAGEERSEGDNILQKLTEVKEGCVLSGQRDILARVSVPRFLNRYLRLAGVAADARAVAGEFWSLYGMRVAGELAPPLPVPCTARVFRTAQARLAALVRRVAALAEDGHAVMVALRSQVEAQAVMEALSAAGFSPGLVSGQGAEADRVVLAGIGRPGSVVLSCYPAERTVSRVAADVPLHLLVAELHDAKRHLVRLCSIYAASTCESLLSLEDPAMQTLLPPFIGEWCARGAGAGGELPSKWSQWLASYAQAAQEREQRLLREELRSRDVYLNEVLAFSGRND